jgi:formamidopyrimidine-DNA glycosylase
VPELPEVEVLVRHLAPILRGKRITRVTVNRPKVLAPTTPARLRRALTGTRFLDLERRGKYLLFQLCPTGRENGQFTMLGHLGMTGRMYLLPASAPPPKHAAVVLALGRQNFIFEDTRYFGRLTLNTDSLARLGPEPLGDTFELESFAGALARSSQAIKTRLLDQSTVAGIGNIYASESLFRAGIRPTLPARRLKPNQVARLWQAIREVLAEAIQCGSTVPLDFGGGRRGDRLFYFGRAPGTPDYYTERLQVYDRAGEPCPVCAAPIKRIVQAGRSSFFCPACQK